MSRARAVLFFSVWAGALLAGCAAPSAPTPRRPIVPTAVSNLSARQEGGEIVLTFTLPDHSTDREPLAEQPSVEIFRAELAPGSRPDAKSAWRMAYEIPAGRLDLYTKDKKIEFRDPLAPADLGHTDGFPVAYMVRTREVRARASNDSNYLVARAFPPPPVPGSGIGKVTEHAIVLSWGESTAPQGGVFAGYRVYRTELESGEKQPQQGLAQSNLKKPLEMIGTTPTNEYRDERFEFGATYLYAVRSVATFGADQVESGDSPSITVEARDVFPPGAPAGLEAAVLLATPQSGAYVELSWEISPESDLAGYRIYRSDEASGSGVRLNPELLPGPSFRDIAVVSGKKYFYSVTAVDQAGNESERSSEVAVEIP